MRRLTGSADWPELLLIIFMVTAPIIQQGVQVTLPKVKAAALPGKELQFVVSITRGGENSCKTLET